MHEEVALLGLPPSDTAFLIKMTRSFYDTAFVSTGIDGMMRHAASLPPADESRPSALDFNGTLRPVIETAMIGLQLFALRIGVLILTLPFLVLVTLAAMADGFVGWFLRRTGEGNGNRVSSTTGPNGGWRGPFCSSGPSISSRRFRWTPNILSHPSCWLPVSRPDYMYRSLRNIYSNHIVLFCTEYVNHPSFLAKSSALRWVYRLSICRVL